MRRQYYELVTQSLKLFAWLLTLLAVGISTLAWYQGLRLGLRGINSYELFPLFGLIAFSVMWSHYIMAALRSALHIDKAVLKTYFETTSWIVLVSLLLHSGLLMWQLWRDGFGAPPGNVLESYVAPVLHGAVIIGAISLVAFLLYEFRRLFETKAWWKWLQYASDVAMLGVLYHGWQLGSHIREGWYQAVWVAYAITLVVVLAYRYYGDISRQLSALSNDKPNDLTHNRNRRQ